MARITGNVEPTIALAEHDDTGGANTKKSLAYGWDSSGMAKVRLKVDSDGVLQTSGSGGGSVTQGTTPWVIGDGSGSITVDGTFWQATQPVSGTFWQATQPVSATDLNIR